MEILLMIDEKQLERLKDDQVFINERLAELEARIAQLRLPPSSYRQQELLSEQSTWAAHHRVITDRIRELTSPDPARVSAAERVETLRQKRVETYRKQCFEMAESYEREGDFRQASLSRLEALNARKIAEHEVR